MLTSSRAVVVTPEINTHGAGYDTYLPLSREHVTPVNHNRLMGSIVTLFCSPAEL